MIRSFRCQKTEAFFRFGVCAPVWQRCARAIRRKLDYLDSAGRVEDLGIPPGNRLEKLHGDRAEQWSIRINGQWQLCFRWNDEGIQDVEIVDYH